MNTKNIIDLLSKAGCVRKGNFTLKSGKVIDSYFDLRLLTAHPKALKKIVQGLVLLAQKIDYEAVIAIPIGGISLATGFSLLTGKPMGYVRKYPKKYGCMKWVEGVDIKPFQKILLFDDLIGSGGSSLKALRILRGKGAIVKDLVVVVDRREDPKKSFAGVKVHSLLNCKNSYV